MLVRLLTAAAVRHRIAVRSSDSAELATGCWAGDRTVAVAVAIAQRMVVATAAGAAGAAAAADSTAPTASVAAVGGDVHALEFRQYHYAFVHAVGLMRQRPFVPAAVRVQNLRRQHVDGLDAIVARLLLLLRLL